MLTPKELILLRRGPSVIHIFPAQILTIHMDQYKSFFRLAVRFIGPPPATNSAPCNKMDLVLYINILKKMKMSL